MGKILAIDYEKCTGCRLCEMVCSVKHDGVSNPHRSRITVVKWEWVGKYVPITCQQCQSAPCMEVCPVKAISRDKTLDSVVVSDAVCIGCRMCVAVCPFGAMIFDKRANKVKKCDFCGGEPQCARFCEPRAVRYVESTAVSNEKKVAAADKYAGVMDKVTAAMDKVLSSDR